MSSAPYRAAERCRICRQDALEPILDLGAQPPANALRASLSEPQTSIPLAISRCSACATVQLSHTVDPEFLFRDYVWVTGTSQVARAYSERFRDEIEKRLPRKGLSVLEIASNDGTFLARFKERGHTVLGVDPARNLAKAAAQAGIPTRAEFFSAGYARALATEQGRFDVVFARNVLPHVPDPMDVIAGMAHALKDDGLGAIEFHRADVILDELHYDSIYHEHVFYHSITSLEPLLAREGLALFDVEESPISGGSWILYFSRGARPRSAALDSALRHEAQLGVGGKLAWLEFSRRCEAHRKAFRRLMDDATRGGARVIGYGASARSSTLLNFCGIGANQLACIADAAPLKHGRYTPGSNVRIDAPAQAFAQRPAAVALLAWNFAEEILDTMRRSLGFSGRVIIPLPREPREVRI